MKRLLAIFVLLLLTATALLLPDLLSPPDGEAVSARLVNALPAPEGFARADGTQPLSLPEDFGPHPDYQTEWWYYTGNLETQDGRRFGYQLTFFRRSLLPAEARAERASDWGTEQVYMAHFALTDAEGEAFQAFERLARGAAGLAGAQAEPYKVWLGGWQVAQVEPGIYHLAAGEAGLALDLTLRDDKGPVLQGDQGYNRKGPEAGDASYYYSQTRLLSSGAVTVGGETFEVQGLSWKDHEYSTRALSSGQVGWDWFALQLDDGTDLMVYRIRREDGSSDPFSGGTLIGADGSARPLERQDFEITADLTWRSPHSGAEYPARWRVSVPSADLTLTIEPVLADQELNLSFIYWEGAVDISGEHSGEAVSGVGYVELTGYAASMEDQL